MKISIISNGFEHSVDSNLEVNYLNREQPDDTTATEAIELFKGLLLAVGYSDGTIEKALFNVLNQD